MYGYNREIFIYGVNNNIIDYKEIKYMKTNNNVRKIWVAAFVVTLFLISSMVPVNAGLTETAEQKPISTLDDADSNDIFSAANDDLNQIDMQQGQLQGQTIGPPPFYYHDRYAVIIVGTFGDEQHYKWFSKDAQRQYNLTTQKFGFNNNNVYVLFTQKSEWTPDPSFNPNIIYKDATEENIKTVFNDLENKMNPHGYDLLYVVVIAHGLDLGWYYGDLLHKKFSWWPEGDIFPNGHDTYFGVTKPTGGSGEQEQEIEYLSNNVGNYYSNQSAQLPQSFQSTYYVDNYDNCSKIDDRVFDHELNDYTRDIPARRIIFVLNPCMSGGFVNDLSGKNRVIITACKEDEYANASFIGPFYYGLNGSADYNGDGRVSLAEVFDYTSTAVKDWLSTKPLETPENPLLDDNGDGVGHNNTESGYDPTTEEKDGYVAARIYNLSYEEINYPPGIPRKPRWYELWGIVGQQYQFDTRAVDPEGDNISYLFDWDDGTTSGWVGPLRSGIGLGVFHSWSVRGSYYVRVKAKDEHGAKSDWSDSLIVVIRPDLPGNSNSFPQYNQNIVAETKLGSSLN